MRFGVDIGGTFTDAVLIDGAAIWTAKSPTTANIAEGVLASCELAATKTELMIAVQPWLSGAGSRRFDPAAIPTDLLMEPRS